MCPLLYLVLLCVLIVLDIRSSLYPIAMYISYCVFSHDFLLSIPTFRQRANVELGEKSSFLVNTVYNDEDTYILIGAAAEVLGKMNFSATTVMLL